MKEAIIVVSESVLKQLFEANIFICLNQTVGLFCFGAEVVNDKLPKLFFDVCSTWFVFVIGLCTLCIPNNIIKDIFILNMLNWCLRILLRLCFCRYQIFIIVYTFLQRSVTLNNLYLENYNFYASQKLHFVLIIV